MAGFIKRSDAVSACCKILDLMGACTIGPMCPDSGCSEVRDVFDAIPDADVVERDEGIRIGAELAAMHGSDATSQELEKAYFDGMEEGYKKGMSERKTGQWIYDPDGMDWGLPAWRCSECKGRNDMIPTSIQYKDGPRRVTDPYRWAGSSFCPNCGTKMGAKDENERISTMADGEPVSLRAEISGHDKSYTTRVHVKPVRHDYGDNYYKYSCPVCDSLGLRMQILPGADHCMCCGVNLSWGEQDV